MRYLPLTSDDRRAMLTRIGAPDMDTLYRDVPASAIVACRLSTFPIPRANWKSSAH